MEPRAKSSVLLIYTGGTIGMKPDPETGVLAPFDFSTIYDEFPYLGKLDVELEVINLTPIGIWLPVKITGLARFTSIKLSAEAE